MTDLERERNYFRSQAENQQVPAEDRVLWAHLADEIDEYLTHQHEQQVLL